MKNQTLKNSILSLTAALMLSACGAQNTDSNTDFSSRLPDSGSDSTKPVAYCNEVRGSSFTVRTQAYIQNSVLSMEYVFARITSVPSSFAADQGNFAMWRWMVDGSGSPSLDSTPLEFLLTNRSTGAILTSSWLKTVRWSDVQSIAAGLGYSDPTTFFNNVNILVNLRDVQGDYDVLKVSYYNTAGQAIDEVNGLLPPFHANPTHYATEPSGAARPTVLRNLHPFANLSAQSNYQSLASAMCLN